MDIFCLPSLYEGLPVVGIEAQAAGLPCVFSDKISDDIKITDSIKFIKLTDKLKKWSDEVTKIVNSKRPSTKSGKYTKDYNIEKAVTSLEVEYFSKDIGT